ncbi:MAG: Fic family protein [Candidatus Bipolaricaulis sp.]|nr:Fic family protein [Candidatus Bipolaricaulis sp.]MDD5645663.1 Fic family protein [Candidatus Bipolaricaulis sp.]
MDPKEFTASAPGRVIRAAAGYPAFIPNPLPPELSWTPDIVSRLSRADRALGELSGIGRALPNPHLLILPFARREAVLSSRIEGTQASLSDLFAFEASQRSEDTSDVREVFNYVRALEYGLARVKDLPVSLRLIREIHEKLMQGVRGEHSTPGEFRRSQNWIGPPGCLLNDATFVPPPVDEMRTCLDAFELFLHSKSDIPPLVQLAVIHYQFEAIHPFLDGNGRVGRLILVMLLCLRQLLSEPLLYLSAYLEAHRQEYYELLLSVSQRGAWKEWVLFFLEGVESQARDAVQRSRRIQDLRTEYRTRFQTTQASAKLLQVVDLLFGAPVVTVSQVKEAVGVTFPSASRYIAQLEEAGIVKEITGQARNRLYRASEIIRAIEGPLEEDVA